MTSRRQGAGRWTLAILSRLADGGRRYQELDEALDGVSHKTFASYCTSLGCSGRSPFVEPTSLVLDEPGITGFGWLVEPDVLGVDGVGDEQAGGVPNLDGGDAHTEALGSRFNLHPRIRGEQERVAQWTGWGYTTTSLLQLESEPACRNQTQICRPPAGSE